MAGIGFELRKLYRESGLLKNLQAYTYSSIVTIGPMICCMIMIIALQRFLERNGVPFGDRELFQGVVVYAFIFSILFTNGLLMMLTRFVSDKLFLKEYRYLLPAWHGSMIICLGAGGLIGAIFLYFSPLPIGLKLTGYLLYMVLIIIWTQNLFVSALQQYMKIVKAFAAGTIVCIGFAYLIFSILEIRKAISMVVALDLGFITTAVMLMLQLERTFRMKESASVFAYFTYAGKVPSLLGIGFFTSLGLYIHQFIYWLWSDYSISIENTFRIAPFYDTAVFYAFITVIPSMVIFIVSMETQFYSKFKAYYQTVLNSGTIGDILRARKEMVTVMMHEISFLMGVQLIFSIVGIAFGIKLLPRIGFNQEQLLTYNILVAGYYVYTVGTIIQLILLYFDDRKGVLQLTALFLLLDGSLTYWMLPLNNHGLSFFVASFIMIICSLVRLLYILKNINYYTFSAQPIFVPDRKPWFSRRRKKRPARL